jgi:hypothetical protein
VYTKFTTTYIAQERAREADEAAQNKKAREVSVLLVKTVQHC